MRVARRPSRTASVFLPTWRSVSMSRRLLTTRIAVTSNPTGNDGPDRQRRDRQRLQVGAADHGHDAEEDEHEQVAQRVVAERPRPARVGQPGQDRQHADHAGSASRRRATRYTPTRAARPNVTNVAISTCSGATIPLCVTRGGPSRSAVSAPLWKSKTSLAKLVPIWINSAATSAATNGPTCELHGRRAAPPRSRPARARPPPAGWPAAPPAATRAPPRMGFEAGCCAATDDTPVA